MGVPHSHLDIEAVKAILSKLPNLSKLSVHGIDLTSLDTSRTKNVCPASLQYLSFRYMEISGGLSLSSVLSYFTPVDNLELIDVLTEQPQMLSTELDAPKCPVIQSVKLQLMDGLNRNHLVHEHIQLESLSELHFSFSFPEQLRIIIPIIRRTPRLNHLSLVLDAFGQQPNPLAELGGWTELNIASITSLETLSIGFELEPPLTLEDHTIWSLAASLLSSAPSTLSNVTFSDMVLSLNWSSFREECLELLDWKLLEQSLSRFSQLRGFKITIALLGVRDALTASAILEKSRVIIQRQLRDLRQQGKLEVVLEARWNV
ncbi:hypothetical protein NLI96_g9055 [Meripilus lineatus]|uniref:F-box domain-containing protein n=1 Tax=Meripilus lineatus TaxID=2056292 RepID=A0AAD5UW53_9APHY|nr:hypothetical protein NLI96_g9055 [Physisporinus lineatus]